MKIKRNIIIKINHINKYFFDKFIWFILLLMKYIVTFILQYIMHDYLLEKWMKMNKKMLCNFIVFQSLINLIIKRWENNQIYIKEFFYHFKLNNNSGIH
jgi:uncharacterized membrane protein